MTTISTKEFHYDAETKTFSADMSTLDMGGRRQVFCQAYTDACDAGIRVESASTGREVMYAVVKQDMNDTDIAGWHLEPTADSIRRVPQCKGTKLFIVNT